MFLAVYPLANQQPKPAEAINNSEVTVTVAAKPKPVQEEAKPPIESAPVPQPEPVQPPQPRTYTGIKFEWLAAAGVPESDWEYADYIVSRESSWNPNALGALVSVWHNGVLIQDRACGLAQSLPCSKIPGDWRDPVNALKWQYQYISKRYGGYYGAYQFWVVHHWY